MRTILVTGCAGFIGSNFLPLFIQKHHNYKIIHIDNLSYAGNLENLSEINDNKQYTFINGDICDRVLLTDLFKKYRIDGVIHFAAESHVDNSIENPGIFMQTNVIGTFTLIDVAYSFWMDEPSFAKSGFEQARFLHISTDEVYGSLGKTGLFTEETAYAPNSPYSASKASSDMIVRSYHHTFGMNTIITNCSNNYGPKQHDEKLIPTIIRNAICGNAIPIYGDGQNIRDWLYVDDHCRGIDLAFHSGMSGETYNIGGKNERTNIYIANKICTILDRLIPNDQSYSEQITYVKDRAGHDKRYAIDATKLEKELGWIALETFESGIEKTVSWYLKKYKF